MRDHRAERRVAGGGYEENLRMTFAMTTGGVSGEGREEMGKVTHRAARRR